jgi:hypothetical protein
MDVEQLYAEAEAYYDVYEQEHGIYMSMELDLLYVYGYIEQHLAAGCDPDEILVSAKQMITGAADMAEMVKNGEESYD